MSRRIAVRLLCLLLLLVRESSCFITPRVPYVNSVGHVVFSTTRLLASDDDWISKIDVEDDPSTDTSLKPRRRRRGRPRLIRRTDASTSARQEQVQEQASQARQRQETAQQDPTLLSDDSYASLLDLSPPLLRALQQELGPNPKMTRIQAVTYRAAVDGTSMLARARTGTGKTLAFLVPLVQRLLQNNVDDYSRRRQGGMPMIGILIVAPTRELAVQIGDAATQLVQYTSPRIAVHTVHGGGTNIQRHVRMLATSSNNNSNSRAVPSLLVATPGRLLDLMEERVRGSMTMRQVLGQTPMLVLDEADFLVQGFYRETQQLLQALPRKGKRQTLLFSATTPRRLRRLLRNVASNSNDDGDDESPGDYIEILHVDDLNSDDIQQQQQQDSSWSRTMSSSKQDENRELLRVQESYICLPDMKLYISALLALVDRTVQQEQSRSDDDDDGGSIIIFFPTARLVKFFATLFRQQPLQHKQDVCVILEMHSQMSQSARRRVSETFRRQEAMSSGTRSRPTKILFTSDVSARGLDYPNVNLVIQYGLPSSRELYIHRLGRTARCGNQGRGLLVAMPFERVSDVVRVNKTQRSKHYGRKSSSSSSQGNIVEDEELSQLVKSSLDDWCEQLESIQSQVRGTVGTTSNASSASRRNRNVPSNSVSLGSASQAAYSSFVAYYVEHGPRRGVAMSEIRQASETLGREALGMSQLPELPPTLADKLAG